MKAFSKNLQTLIFLGLITASTSVFANSAAVRILSTGVEAFARFQRTAADQELRGLGKMLKSEVGLKNLSGLEDADIGLLFNSLRLAARDSLGREIESVDDFVKALEADKELNEIVNRTLSDVDTGAKLTSKKLAVLVSETAAAKEAKFKKAGLSYGGDIIPCHRCGITRTLDRLGVRVYLKEMSEAEKAISRNAALSKNKLLASLGQSLAQFTDESGKRTALKLSATTERALNDLDRLDQGTIAKIANDAARSFNKEHKALAKAALVFSRDGDQSVDLLDPSILRWYRENTATGARGTEGLQTLMDQANTAYPKATDGLERRKFFCTRFKANARATPEGRKDLAGLVDSKCYASILSLCR